MNRAGSDIASPSGQLISRQAGVRRTGVLAHPRTSTLRTALGDFSENMKLADRLGELTIAL